MVGHLGLRQQGSSPPIRTKRFALRPYRPRGEGLFEEGWQTMGRRMARDSTLATGGTLPVRLELPAWLPAAARVVLEDVSESSMRGKAYVGRRAVARLVWMRDGQLMHEQRLDAKGKAHGLEIERDEPGEIQWCAQWVHGRQHGLTLLFDRRGRPLLVTEFVRGRGTDIWMGCGPAGQVSEVRGMLDGQLHGLLRWGNPQRPWEEEHYWRGKRHGIFRTWKDDKLVRGFPRFFVNDEHVARRAYDAAQAEDASLPRYDKRDNINRRPMPPVVRDALARAKALRRTLGLVDQLRRMAAVRPGMAAPVEKRVSARRDARARRRA